MEFLEKERRGSEDTLSSRKETRTLVTSQPKNAGGKPWKSKPSGETVLAATSTPEDKPSSSYRKGPKCPLCLTTHDCGNALPSGLGTRSEPGTRNPQNPHVYAEPEPEPEPETSDLQNRNRNRNRRGTIREQGSYTGSVSVP